MEGPQTMVSPFSVSIEVLKSSMNTMSGDPDARLIVSEWSRFRFQNRDLSTW